MLSKLIKHDFRALSRTLLPMQLGILGAAVLCTLLMAVNIRVFSGAAQTAGQTTAEAALMLITVLVTVLVVIAIAASALVTILLVAMHFYRNFMGDEGYLTFTLPTTTGRLLWSKLITGAVWVLINLAVICLSALIFGLFGTSDQTLMNNGVWALLGELVRGVQEVFSGHTLWVTVQLLLGGLVAVFYQLMQIYLSVVVGGQIAKKHKLLASIGMYLAINMGVSILTSILTAVFAFSATGLSILNNQTSLSGVVSGVTGYGILLSAALGTVFFLISRNILKNHLNLQ